MFSFHISFIMCWFKDASIVPDFGKEEIPIIAMTHVTAGSEKNGMKEMEEWRKLNFFDWSLDNAYEGKWGRYL